MPERHYYHMYSIGDRRAKIIIEWSAPDGISEDKFDTASDLADELLSKIWMETHKIVEAME